MGDRSAEQRAANRHAELAVLRRGRSSPPGPAYQPRSRPSSAGISGSATSRGSPPTAGVGCSRPASSTAGTGSRSWARIGVARCWTFWTFTSSGSSAAAIQRLTGSRVRSIRRATIACSSRSFGLLSELLAEVVVDRRVGAAPRRAGQRHRLRARAVAAHEQLGAGTEERQLRRADAEAVAGREDLAQGVEHRRRVDRARRVHAHLARQHDLLELARRGSARPRGPPPPRSATGGSALATRGRATGSGSSSGIEPGTSSASRACARSTSASGASSPSTATFTVSRASPSWRASATSGRTSCAGASDAPLGRWRRRRARTRSRREHGPGCGGARRGRRPGRPPTVRRARLRIAQATSSKRSAPRASTANDLAERGQREAAAVGLLEAEEAVLGLRARAAPRPRGRARPAPAPSRSPRPARPP